MGDIHPTKHNILCSHEQQFVIDGKKHLSSLPKNIGFQIAWLKPYIYLYFYSGQEENRTPMISRSSHFECDASTNFATRPWVQLHYYTLFLRNATTFDILCCLPSDQFLAPAVLALDAIIERCERL